MCPVDLFRSNLGRKGFMMRVYRKKSSASLDNIIKMNVLKTVLQIHDKLISKQRIHVPDYLNGATLYAVYNLHYNAASVVRQKVDFRVRDVHAIAFYNSQYAQSFGLDIINEEKKTGKCLLTLHLPLQDCNSLCDVGFDLLYLEHSNKYKNIFYIAAGVM